MKQLRHAIGALLVLILFVVAHTLCHEAEGAIAAEVPTVIQFEGEGFAKQPDGSTVRHPAGTQVDACESTEIGPLGFPIVLELFPDTRSLHALSPCVRVFADGFED